jgi:HTH-type transcriptional regulator, sugar sensing transcriptional regulator
MNEQLISQIEELGLSNKEARVYVANLMLGAAGVQQIADTSGIKRVTTYVILESLGSLGLVSQTTKAKKTLFNAESPENLRRLLDKKEQSIQEQKSHLDEILPDLKGLSSITRETPIIRFYDGAEGIRTIQKLFWSEMSATDEPKITYGISNLDHVNTFFPDIVDNSGNPDRIALGIKSKFLYTSKDGAILKATDTSRNRESRFLPYDKFPIDGDISIKGGKVIVLSLQGSKPSGFVIHSAEYSKTMLSLFNLSWESAEKYN